jgi:hypothetical protein
MKIFAGIVVLALCVGCAGNVPERGNPAGVDSAELVQDVVFIMFETYPPARTRLALVQKTDDAFGKGLAEALRLHGYAVAEYVESAGLKWGGAKEAVKPDGLPFAYLIAATGAENEIRVTLHVGTESLSRLYEVAGKGGKAQYLPLGFWSRRVDGKETDDPTASADQTKNQSVALQE